MEVIKGVHMFKASGNYFLIQGKKPVLVDAGGKRSFFPAKRHLKKAGCPPENVSEIVVTHYHSDHAGCLMAFKENFGTAISVGEGDAPYISGEREPERSKGVTVFGRLQANHPGLLAWYQKYPPVKPDRLLRGGDAIDCLGGLEVIETPGHTPGHICLYSKEKSLMFIGDAIFHFFRRFSMGFKDYFNDLEEAKDSAKKLAEYDFEVACFGHGPPILKGASRRIESFTKSL